MHAPSQPFDAITAFAVPNPNCSSQSRRFLQVWLLNRLPRRVDHSVYFGLAKVYFSQPFRLSTGSNAKQFPHRCQCRFLVQSPNSSKHARRECNPLQCACLWKVKITFARFSTACSTALLKIAINFLLQQFFEFLCRCKDHAAIGLLLPLSRRLAKVHMERVSIAFDPDGERHVGELAFPCCSQPASST